MSAFTVSRGAQARRERRRREQLEEEARAIPVKLYGLRRGTVTGLTALSMLFAMRLQVVGQLHRDGASAQNHDQA